MIEPFHQQKKAAARQAAAQHATNAALTGQTEQLTGQGHESLEEEMCSLLPAFRHPVHDALSEYILFVDPAGVSPCKSSKSPWPAVVIDDPHWLQEEFFLCQQQLRALALFPQDEGNVSDSLLIGHTTAASIKTLHSFRRQRAYLVYLHLVRHRGLTRREALSAVRDLFVLPDTAVTLQLLKEEQEEVARRWQRSAPCLTETVLARWKGLLPGT